MSELEQLLDTVAEYAGHNGAELVARAARFAEECHKGFSRLDGSLYFDHSVKVATILAEWHAPPEIIAAGLLHDVLKPSYSKRPSLAAIAENLPCSVVSTVQKVAHLGRLGPLLRKSPLKAHAEETRHIGNGARLSWATAMLQREPMVIVIKIADRLHNLETLDVLPKERQEKFATTALNMFVPFADRLGMGAAKRQLQDDSLRILDPQGYVNADGLYQAALSDSRAGDLVGDLQQALDDSSIPARVLRHWANRYDIYRRQLETGGKAATAIEILSLIVLTNSVEDCYRAFGIVHSKYSPLNTFHDYIAVPRPNGYRALQTLVSKQSLGVFQVLLCTEQMHLVAEYGITARWRGVNEELLPRITPLPEPPEGHIMLLTPKGDIKYLPNGATPVDFAYSIHTEVGHRCLIALVNGTRAPLNTSLEDGDIVDIIVGRGVAGPNEEWLNSVVTDTAKQEISKWTRRRKTVELVIEAWDRIGLVQDISAAISSKGLNMSYVHADALVDGKASIHIGLGQIDKGEIDQLQQEIGSMSYVIRIRCEAPETPPLAHPRSIVSRRARGNPYTLQAVFGRDFKGRERVIDDIVHRLRGQDQDSALLIWGQRRIGKTSLLRHLERYILPGRRHLPVFVNMEDVRNQSIAVFLHRMAFEIQEKVQHEEIHAPTVNKMKREPIYYFRRFIDRIEQTLAPQTLLIIVDEFQCIGELGEESATRQEVFSCLRSLVQHGVAINFLFSGGGVPERLLPRSGLSALLSVVDNIRIDCLDRKGAEAVVTQLDPSTEYTDQAVERLLEVTRCHPCYLQFLCRELYEIAGQRRINLSDVEEVIDETLQWRPKLENLVDHFWTLALEGETIIHQKNRLVLSAIADGVDPTGWTIFDEIADRTRPYVTEGELVGLLDDLVYYGSIDADGLNYRIRIPLFELWLRAMYPFERTARMIGGYS